MVDSQGGENEEEITLTDLHDSKGRPVYQTADGALFKLEDGKRKWIATAQGKIMS